MQMMVNKRIVVGLGLLLIGLVILVALIQGLREVAVTSRWPAVTGTVLSSTVERRASYGDQGEFEGWLFTPRVTYRYEAGGLRREGRTLSLWEAWSSSEAWARQQSGRYPVGSAVQVYHSRDGARRPRARREAGSVGLAPAARRGDDRRYGPAADAGTPGPGDNQDHLLARLMVQRRLPPSLLICWSSSDHVRRTKRKQPHLAA